MMCNYYLNIFIKHLKVYVEDVLLRKWISGNEGGWKQNYITILSIKNILFFLTLFSLGIEKHPTHLKSFLLTLVIDS